MNKLKLKTEFQSSWIKDPFGPNQLWMKEVPESMYPHLSIHGYSNLFEEEQTITTTIKTTGAKDANSTK